MVEIKPVDEWAEGKPPLIVAFAYALLPYAELADRWLKILAAGEASKYLGPVPPLSVWRQFYSRDHSAVASVLDQLPQFNPELPNSQLMNQVIGVINRLNADEVDQLVKVGGLADPKAAETWAQQLEKMVGFMRRAGGAVLGLPIEPRNPNAPPVPPDFQFLLRVVVPNWLLQGRSIYASLEAARNGDLDTLDVLLRLDRSLVADPAIAEQIHRASNDADGTRWHSLSLTLTEKPTMPSRKALKSIAFGVLSTLSKRAGVRLEEPEIRQLADAFARAKFGGGALCDLELPDSPEGLTKAIQRGRKDFEERIRVDKLELLFVQSPPGDASNLPPSGETESGSAGMQPDKG